MLKPSLQILYGSQTGSAQDAAQRIARQAQRKRIQVRLLPLNAYDVVSAATVNLLYTYCVSVYVYLTVCNTVCYILISRAYVKLPKFPINSVAESINEKCSFKSLRSRYLFQSLSLSET